MFEAVWQLLDVEPSTLWEFLSPQASDQSMILRSGVHLERLRARRDELARAVYAGLLEWIIGHVGLGVGSEYVLYVYVYRSPLFR